MGIGGNIEMSAPFEDALDGRLHRTITVDAPGTGASTGYRFPRRMLGLAETMERMLDALGFDQVDVLGVSFGGVLAQQLAHHAPHRVRRLVLANTGPGLGGVPASPQMGYHDLEDKARPTGTPGRKAIAIAGDDPADLHAVASIVDALGFDPIVAGQLADGVRLQPGTEPFGASVDAAELRAMLDRFPDSEHGRVVLHTRTNA